MRTELGYAVYLGALQRYRGEYPHDLDILTVSRFLLNYPFADRLFPRALDVIEHVKQWGPVAVLTDGDVVFQPRKVDRSGLSDAVTGLLELANLGVLEFHVWGCREDNVEKPDIMVFDLDPDPSVGIAALADAAKLLRARLESAGLKSFLKTTGGKGYHVVAPIKPQLSWDDVKEFARAMASEIVKEEPKKYTATMTKAKRKGKIYIDFLRNSRGATFIVPFSTRARANAPVSMPLAWSELRNPPDPAAWTIHSVAKHMKKSREAWADFFKAKQKIRPSKAR